MEVYEKAPKRPSLRIFGGGWTRAPWTISHIPRHDSYLEPCFGGGSILLRKPPAPMETVNDKDGRIVNFMRMLRTMPDELKEQIDLTPWAEDEMEYCRPISPVPLEDARRFFFICWMSFKGGPQNNGHFRVGYNFESRYAPPPTDAIERGDLLAAAARIKNVQILNRDALDVVEKFFRSDTTIVFDPPYVPDTRERLRGYNHEPDIKWRKEMAKMLVSAKGPVLIAGYANLLYQELYENAGFHRVERLQSTNGGSKRIECLWLSPLTVQRLERDAEDERKRLADLEAAEQAKYPLLYAIRGGG